MSKVNDKSYSPALTEYPNIIKEWDYEKNSLDPSKITYGSGRKVWWKCKNYKHSWLAKVCHRTNGSNCPYCTGLKPTIDKSLATLNPDISAEWHQEGNGNLTPFDVTPKSGLRVFWKCSKCNYIWDSVIRKRMKCPKCNSLGGQNPKLSTEWHPTLNKISPFDISPRNGKKAWWICKQNPNHIWEAIISHRSHGAGCPICNASIAEKTVYDLLQELTIPFIYQYKDQRCKFKYILSFDFAINIKRLILIEINGKIHYSKSGFRPKEIVEKELELSKTKGDIKEKFCQKYNIPLLKIPYWEFDNIETILLDFINKYNA